MKILVVEGPDNAGKSTLALRLAKDLKAVSVNSQVVPPPHEYWVKDYVRWLNEAAKWNQQIVMDRHPIISEPIYGPSIRGRCPLTPAYCREVQRELFVIYCRPPLETILNFGERAQMKGVVDNAERIVMQYDDLFYNLPHAFGGLLFYDWTKDSYNLFLNLVRNVLREQ